MAEQILDGNGSGYFLAINPDGSINANTSMSGGISVVISGTSLDRLCTENMYSGLIIANGSWIGSYCDVLNYSAINVLAKPDNPGSLYIDYSDTGSSAVRTSYIYGCSGIGNYSSLSPRMRYFRLRYINDGNPNQLLISTILSEEPRGATYLPLIAPLTDNYTTLSTKAILAGKTPNGSYINVDVTAGGNLKISVEDWNGAYGKVYTYGTNPIGSNYNPQTVLVYSGTAIGSIYKNLSTGSIVKVLSYDASGNLVSIGAWSSV